MSEVTCEITEHIVTLSHTDAMWSKELNRVKWNGVEKWDIRTWSPDHTKYSKGVTLTDEEFHELRSTLFCMIP